MHDLSHYFSQELFHERKDLPREYALSSWRGKAAKRAQSLRHRDERVTAVIDRLVADGGYDRLLLGWTDDESRRLRDELVSRASEAMRALFERDDPRRDEVMNEYAQLDLSARFPYLGEQLYSRLASLEHDWGYRRSLTAEVITPGAVAASSGCDRILLLERQPQWPAARVGTGDPTSLPIRVDSAQFAVPHAIELRTVHNLTLIELWMYPQDDTDSAAWEHVWCGLQDDARLVPFDTVEADSIDHRLLDDLGPFATAVAEWHRRRITEHRAVANKYARDGAPYYAR